MKKVAIAFIILLVGGLEAKAQEGITYPIHLLGENVLQLRNTKISILNFNPLKGEADIILAPKDDSKESFSILRSAKKEEIKKTTSLEDLIFWALGKWGVGVLFQYSSTDGAGPGLLIEYSLIGNRLVSFVLEGEVFYLAGEQWRTMRFAILPLLRIREILEVGVQIGTLTDFEKAGLEVNGFFGLSVPLSGISGMIRVGGGGLNPHYSKSRRGFRGNFFFQLGLKI